MPQSYSVSAKKQNHMMSQTNDALATFLLSQAELRRAGPLQDGPTQESLRATATKALDTAMGLGAAVQSDKVDLFLLRPPFTSHRPAAASERAAGSSIAERRAALCRVRPRAAGLIRWMDARAEVHEPYRRLASRHLPWAEASVVACIQAVQKARKQSPGQVPWVLVAEGSLGAEAAAAAATGATVTVCEPNGYAATAIAAVAAQHGVGERIKVVALSLVDFCHAREEEALPVYAPVVVVLTPLLDEAALGRRLLPSVDAVRSWRDACCLRHLEPGAPSASPLIGVPSRVSLSGCLASLTAGVIHGVKLGALDAARWTPYPLAWATEREEDAQLLSPFQPLFDFDVDLNAPATGQVDPEVVDPSATPAVTGAPPIAERHVKFRVTPDRAAAANANTGGEGGRQWTTANAIILHCTVGFGEMVGWGGGSERGRGDSVSVVVVVVGVVVVVVVGGGGAAAASAASSCSLRRAVHCGRRHRRHHAPLPQHAPRVGAAV